jgi:regulator of RNase E activity RraA
MTLEELIAGFRSVATASVADAVDKITGRRGFMDECIKPRINDRKIVGPAVTILEGPMDEVLPPQHALDAIDESPAGSVICISVGIERDVGRPDDRGCGRQQARRRYPRWRRARYSRDPP